MIAIMSSSLGATLLSLASRSRHLATDEHLFHRDDPVSRLFLVVRGRVDLLRFAEDGSRLILQRAGAGDVLAEASVFSPRYHCDATAVAPSEVASIPLQHFREHLRKDADFSEAWARHLGQEIQTVRLRSEILSLKTVAARLGAWLAWHGEVPPKGEWKDLAEQIGVSPEALYRELARRRT
jgi:CRP-like cAMP-binding protein